MYIFRCEFPQAERSWQRNSSQRNRLHRRQLLYSRPELAPVALPPADLRSRPSLLMGGSGDARDGEKNFAPERRIRIEGLLRARRDAGSSTGIQRRARRDGIAPMSGRHRGRCLLRSAQVRVYDDRAIVSKRRSSLQKEPVPCRHMP